MTQNLPSIPANGPAASSQVVRPYSSSYEYLYASPLSFTAVQRMTMGRSSPPNQSRMDVSWSIVMHRHCARFFGAVDLMTPGRSTKRCSPSRFQRSCSRETRDRNKAIVPVNSEPAPTKFRWRALARLHCFRRRHNRPRRHTKGQCSVDCCCYPAGPTSERSSSIR